MVDFWQARPQKWQPHYGLALLPPSCSISQIPGKTGAFLVLPIVAALEMKSFGFLQMSKTMYESFSEGQSET
jgi:hypothetical protein